MRKNRKKEIFHTAIRLFKEKSYDEVTVIDICNACNMTKKAFYYHFRSKEQLILDYYRIIEDEFNWKRILEQADEPDADYFELYWQYECYIIESTVRLGADLLKVLMRYDLVNGKNFFSPFTKETFRNPFFSNHAISIIKKGQRAGQIRSDYAPNDLLTALFSAVIGIGFHWGSAKGQYDQLCEVRKIYEMILLPK